MAIAETIKALRLKSGFTQQQLADLTGLALGTIAQYERGLRSPKTEQMQKLAEAFGCTIDAIINEEQDTSRFYLEKIYRQLGYTIYIDDPEHKPFILHEKKQVRVRPESLDKMQEKILAYIRFSLEETMKEEV